MSQIHKHPIPANIAERCLINPEQYQAQYQQSVTDPDAFWGEQGKILDWMRPYTRVKNTSFAPGNVSIKWYEDGTLNLPLTASIATWPNAATRPPSSGKATTPARANTSLIASCIATSAALPTSCSTSALKGRCRRYLYADGAGSRGGHAGLRPYRRDPLGHLRRLLAEAVAGRIIDSNSRLVITADEGLRAGRAIR
jgi:acetyl-CoA synthetase